MPILPDAVAFYLDLDGTLVDIAERPHHVSIDQDLRLTLEALRTSVDGALALVSGRSIEDVDRLFAPSTFCIAGQHGAERRDASRMVHRHGLPLSRLKEAGTKLKRVVARNPDLVLEDKGMNLALHYRLGPKLERTLRATMCDVARDLGEEFELQEGKMVFEIKPAGRDYGTAITAFSAEKPFRDRTPVFIGDDRTDEYGFRVVNRMGGYSIKVGKGPTSARWRLADAGSVCAWLARIVESRSPLESAA